MSAVALMLSWLQQLTRGRPSDAVVTIPVEELLRLEESLRDAPNAKGKGSRGPRTPKGMTSRSKQRKRPDTEYLAFVRRHRCCSCLDSFGVEAHHAGAKNQKGMGMKVPDSMAIPLCTECHTFFHRHGHFHSSGKYQEVLTTEELVKRTRDELQAEWAERKEAF